MSNLFKLDKKTEEIVNQQVFNFVRSDADMVAESANEYKEAEKERKVPFFVKNFIYFFSIGGFIGVMLFGDGILNYGKASSTLGDGLSIVFMIIGAIIFIASIAIIPYGYKKRKEYQNSDKTNEINKKEELSEDQLREKMGVPEGTKQLDNLFSIVKTDKNGVEKEISLLNVSYLNYPSWMWKDEKYLYIVNYFAKVEIPLECIINISLIKKNLTLTFWNKIALPQTYNRDDNKVKSDGYQVRIDKYYQVNIKISDKSFELLVPNYDIEDLENLLDMKAE